MTNVKRNLRKMIRAQDREWYSLRSLLGNRWAWFYILLGGRETRKIICSNGLLCLGMEDEM